MRAATLVLLFVSLGGCTIPLRTPSALIASDHSAPVDATNDGCTGIPHRSPKAYSVFGLIAWGDASIERARQVQPQFLLSRIATIDYRRKQYFGVSTFETVLCGLFVRSLPPAGPGEQLAAVSHDPAHDAK